MWVSIMLLSNVNSATTIGSGEEVQRLRLKIHVRKTAGGINAFYSW